MSDPLGSSGIFNVQELLRQIQQDDRMSVSLQFTGSESTLQRNLNRLFQGEVLNRAVRANTPSGRFTRFSLGAQMPGLIEGGSEVIGRFAESLFQDRTAQGFATNVLGFFNGMAEKAIADSNVLFKQ